MWSVWSVVCVEYVYGVCGVCGVYGVCGVWSVWCVEYVVCVVCGVCCTCVWCVWSVWSVWSVYGMCVVRMWSMMVTTVLPSTQELAWSLHNPKFFLPAKMYERYPSHLHIDLMARAQVRQHTAHSILHVSVRMCRCVCAGVGYSVCFWGVHERCTSV